MRHRRAALEQLYRGRRIQDRTRPAEPALSPQPGRLGQSAGRPGGQPHPGGCLRQGVAALAAERRRPRLCPQPDATRGRAGESRGLDRAARPRGQRVAAGLRLRSVELKRVALPCAGRAAGRTALRRSAIVIASRAPYKTAEIISVAKINWEATRGVMDYAAA